MIIKQMFTNFIACNNLELDLSELKQKAYNIRNSYNQIWLYKKESNLTLQPEFKCLFDAIDQSLNSLHNHFGFKQTLKQQITEMWINYDTSKSLAETHCHAGKFFSGVFYLNAPEGCGGIQFNNPITAHQWVIDPRKHVETNNDFNCNTYTIKPKENMLLVFPSWLEHYVLQSSSNFDRISIAFNSEIVMK